MRKSKSSSESEHYRVIRKMKDVHNNATADLCVKAGIVKKAITRSVVTCVVKQHEPTPRARKKKFLASQDIEIPKQGEKAERLENRSHNLVQTSPKELQEFVH